MPGTDSDNQLLLSVVTSRDSYFLDEPFYLVAKLTNAGSEPLPVPPPRIEPSGVPSNIGLSVKTKKGTTLQPRSREKTGGIEITDRGADSAVLLPGKSWIITVDMLAAYGRGHDRGNMVFRRGRLDRGEYEIEAFYKASFAQTGIIKSGVLGISIVNPPVREQIVRNRLQKAHLLFRSDGSESRRQKAIRLYEEIIRKYPTSRYLPDAYRMLVEYSRDRDFETIKKRVFETQTKFSDPVFLYDMAMHLEETDQMNRDQLIKLLRSILWRIPGSIFSEIVRQRLTFEEMMTTAIRKEAPAEASGGEKGPSSEKRTNKEEEV